jgi:carboxyl-terminal processing protease
MPRFPLRYLLFPALCLAFACATSKPLPRPVTAEEAVADFEAAWKAIDETHFDPDFNGVDWDAIHEEYLPRAEAATNIAEQREVIEEMLGRLEQSHFGVIPEEALPPSTGGEDGETPDEIAGGCGFDVRLREGQLLVTRVKPDGPAAQAGAALGWILLEVDERSAEDVLAKFEASAEKIGERGVAHGMRQVFRKRTFGEVGSTAECTFLDGEDREISLEMVREKRDVIAHAAATTLPTFYLEFDSEIREVDGRRIGIIHFSNWFLPMALRFDEAIDEMRECDGIVIDLRGNGGGALAMCMGLAGHFFDERKQMGTMQTHDTTMLYTANPRRISADKTRRVTPYAGTLAVLIDEASGSASEVFSGGVQSVGRARIFGETSAGAVLGAGMTSLPSGDAIIHAMFNFKTADGIYLEHRGVIPDEMIPTTREELLAGRDAQLDRALQWISSL